MSTAGAGVADAWAIVAAEDGLGEALDDEVNAPHPARATVVAPRAMTGSAPIWAAPTVAARLKLRDRWPRQYSSITLEAHRRRRRGGAGELTLSGECTIAGATGSVALSTVEPASLDFSSNEEHRNNEAANQRYNSQNCVADRPARRQRDDQDQHEREYGADGAAPPPPFRMTLTKGPAEVRWLLKGWLTLGNPPAWRFHCSSATVRPIGTSLPAREPVPSRLGRRGRHVNSDGMQQTMLLA